MNAETGNAQARPRRRVWPKVLLAVSLSLNLLVVGAVAGALWRHAGPHPERSARGDRLLPLVLALPRAERAELREEYAGRMGRASRREGGFDELLAILRAVPFERAALDSHFETLMRTEERRLRIGRQALADSIGRLSDAERADYADRLERRARRWRHD